MLLYIQILLLFFYQESQDFFLTFNACLIIPGFSDRHVQTHEFVSRSEDHGGNKESGGVGSFVAGQLPR